MCDMKEGGSPSAERPMISYYYATTHERVPQHMKGSRGATSTEGISDYVQREKTVRGATPPMRRVEAP